MKRVLLIGIGGVYNYGCEAIVRGTTAILRSTFPDIHIAYASYSHAYDAPRLADLDIEIIDRPSPYRKWSATNLFYGSLSRIGIRLQRPYDTSVSWADGYDAIFSIGGDIYTLDSDNGFDPSLPLFIERVLRRNPSTRYILWGASVGPFDKNPKAVRFFSRHLALVHRIVAREQVTIDYLRSLSITDNVVFAPDPAFFVPFQPTQRKPSERRLIGLNLSPLSAAYAYSSPAEAIAAQAETVRNLVIGGADIVMTPHVQSSNGFVSDLLHMKKILDALPVDIASHVTLIEPDRGFVALKPILSQLDVMIAVRMHCAINAVTCQTPTIFLAYSAKARGMARLIYGNDSFVTPLETFADHKAMTRLIDSVTRPVNLDSIRAFDFRPILSSL